MVVEPEKKNVKDVLVTMAFEFLLNHPEIAIKFASILKPLIPELMKIPSINIICYGEENLKNIHQDTPIIVAGNHIGPREKMGLPMKYGGLTPDVLIVFRKVRESTKKTPRLAMINKPDDAISSNSPDRLDKMRYLLSKVTEAAGQIPVDKSTSPKLHDFISIATETLEKRLPVIIFSEGTWHNNSYNYGLHGIDIKPGTAHLARKVDTTVIIPFYIHVADEIEHLVLNNTALLFFGTPISTSGKKKSEISLELAESILLLEKRARFEHPEQF